jgi:hypothetical protein
MMAGNRTLSYSKSDQGWVSRFSFVPEYIKGMNNYMYTFKNGKLYRHNTNSIRNNFYGVQYSSEITSAFNESPLEVKLFKTLEQESNKPWSATLKTDLHNGSIDSSYFKEKEGTFFSYIRSNEATPNFKMRSSVGIGTCNGVSGVLASTVISFSFSLTNIISVGDAIYAGTTPTLIGSCTAIDRVNNTITVNASSVQPSSGDLILLVKDQVSESLGLRGYYNQFTLTNSDTTEVELFSTATDVFKSHP